MPADRFNAGKPELSYLLSFPKALTELCRVFEYGAGKYSRGNWQKGGKPDEEYLDAALRHIFASQTDPRDEESKCLHLSHAVWNLCALIELDAGDAPTAEVSSPGPPSTTPKSYVIATAEGAVSAGWHRARRLRDAGW